MKKITVSFLAFCTSLCLAGCYIANIDGKNSTTSSSSETMQTEEFEIASVDDETDIARFAATTRSGITPTIAG